MSPRHVELELTGDDVALTVEELECDRKLECAGGEEQNDAGFGVVLEDVSVSRVQSHGLDVLAGEDLAPA